MTVGKPNFNLNSFGIKYLSKDEVQELLNKTQEGDSEQVVDKPQSPKLELNRFSSNPPKGSHKKLTPTRNPESAFYEAKDPEGGSVTPDTRSYFSSREPPAKKRSLTERKLRADVVESGRKNDESNIVTQKIKPQHTGDPSHGSLDRKRDTLGSTVGFNSQGNVPSKDKDGKQRSVNPRTHTKVPKERQEKRQFGDKRPQAPKNLPKHTGDAPKGLKSEEENVSGADVQVGIGEDANQRLQQDHVGDLTNSQKPKEKKEPKGLNLMSDTSKRSKRHDSRGNKYKWQDEKSKKAYKKLKDRESQAKFLDAQDKKYKQSVSTPKTISPAGKKLADMVGKSSDIVMDMNIMKLNLMKDAKDGKGSNKPNPKAKPDMTNLGGDTRDVVNSKTEGYNEYQNQKPYDYVKYPDGAGNRFMGTHTRQIDPDDPEKRGKYIFDKEGIHGAESEYDRISHGGKKPNKQPIKKSAAETLFKAISLKLDLMKDAQDGKSGAIMGKVKPSGYAQGENRRSDDREEEVDGTSFGASAGHHNIAGSSVQNQSSQARQANTTHSPRGTLAEANRRGGMGDDGDFPPSRNIPSKTPKGSSAPKIKPKRGWAKKTEETIFKAISLKLDLMKDVKSKRHNYTKLTSAGKNPAQKAPNSSEALGAAYASGKMTENSVDADTNTETGATGKPKGSVADQYT